MLKMYTLNYIGTVTIQLCRNVMSVVHNIIMKMTEQRRWTLKNGNKIYLNAAYIVGKNAISFEVSGQINRYLFGNDSGDTRIFVVMWHSGTL